VVEEPGGGLRVESEEKMSYTYEFGAAFLDPGLAAEYKQYGRVLIITDTNIDSLYGQQMASYFANHGIPATIAAFDVNENTKTWRTLEKMIDAMQDFNLNRQEPVLLVGGGLVTDVGGFACSAMRRNTPYLRVPTSLIGLIDASIAIKVAVNHADGKNKLGAYHAHNKVFIDTSFLKTLPAKEIRVGMAEIIKISVVADETTFELLEQHSEALVATKFGHVNPDGSLTEGELAAIKKVGEEVVYRAIHRMLELESPNLKEYNLDRAIAFGHTWSPELELQAKYQFGKLIMHGQAVAMDMALSMTIAAERGLVSAADRDRVHKVISSCGLMLDHPVQHDSKHMSEATKEITKTRNGLLRAAVPIHRIGQCTYLNDVSHDELMNSVDVHAKLAAAYPRAGEGIDYWIEPPKENLPNRFVVTPTDLAEVALDQASAGRTYDEVQASIDDARQVISGMDRIVAKYSSQPSKDLQHITAGTADTNALWAELWAESNTQMLMEAEMISGVTEAQLLKFLVMFGKAKDVLDVGTFTGYSALAMAEAVPTDGKVVTVEREPRVAEMAQTFFDKSPVGSKIESRVGSGNDVLKSLADEGAAYDLVFVDADKPGYLSYYQTIMDAGLLKVGGCLVLDNTLYKGEELAGGPLSDNGKAIQQVNEFVLADERVEQVMLPLRDGVTLVYRKA